MLIISFRDLYWNIFWFLEQKKKHYAHIAKRLKAAWEAQLHDNDFFCSYSIHWGKGEETIAIFKWSMICICLFVRKCIFHAIRIQFFANGGN
jgi:hypothetical protein